MTAVAPANKTIATTAAVARALIFPLTSQTSTGDAPRGTSSSCSTRWASRPDSTSATRRYRSRVRIRNRNPMPLSRLAVILSLAIAVPSFGQFGPFTPLAVDPSDPTSSEPVTVIFTLLVSCTPTPTVTRSGFDITVVEPPFAPCGAPPVLGTFRLEVGTLPPGHYTVAAKLGGVQYGDPFGFDVLDASSNVTVSQSIGSTAGGTPVIVTVAAAHCLNQPLSACAAPTITFGGVPATNVTVIDQAHFSATTPPHAPGAVQVVVTDVSFTKSSYAFRYYDMQLAPSAKF